MAIFRGVKRHSQSGMWAYVEWSDENPNHFQIVGNEEFQDKELAEEYSQGFAVDSYEWIEPKELKVKNLEKKRNALSLEIEKIDNELSELNK